MNEDFNLPESVALDVARMVDHHDQPTTSRARRLELQAQLRFIFDAPTTETLRRARTVRKWCVHIGIYVRPERQYEQPKHLFKPGRPITRRPDRYAS